MDVLAHGWNCTLLHHMLILLLRIGKIVRVSLHLRVSHLSELLLLRVVIGSFVRLRLTLVIGTSRFLGSVQILAWVLLIKFAISWGVNVTLRLLLAAIRDRGGKSRVSLLLELEELLEHLELLLLR